MSKVEVPVTPEVLRWAIEESGFSVEDVAAEAGVDENDLNDWLDPDSRVRPGITDVRALARVLRRPVAAFLLPRPPATEQPPVQFRHMPGAVARDLSPVERRYLRKAIRLQRMIAWLVAEMKEPEAARKFRAALHQDTSEAARRYRSTLGVSVANQFEWTSPSIAFDGWRSAIEETGVTVFLFSMGAESCRGFSIAHDTAPIVAVNTEWNDQARTFTLFHEVGHLVTGTSSACTAAPPAQVSGAWDPTERWCERFAASVLIPEEALRSALSHRAAGAVRVDVGTVRWLANRFQASLRAVAIRLIELGAADWALYRELPEAGDAKRRGGRAGKGRDRQEIQEDQLGGRALSLFRRAVDADVISRSQALSYVDVPETALDFPGRSAAR